MYLDSRTPFWFYACLFPRLTRGRYLQALCRVLHTTHNLLLTAAAHLADAREGKRGSTLTFMAFYLLVMQVTRPVLLVRAGKGEGGTDFSVYGISRRERFLWHQPFFLFVCLLIFLFCLFERALFAGYALRTLFLS